MKERLQNILDEILKYKNLVFPILLVVLTSITVVIALGAGGARQDKLEAFESSRAEESTEESTEIADTIEKDTPLVDNEDADITALVMLFFNSRATGDEQGLRSCFEKVNDTDILRWVATAKYTESFPTVEIYTKPGFYEGDTIAYVYFKMVFTGKEAEYPGLQLFYITHDEEGKVCFKNSDISDDVNSYVEKVSLEADVADLRNNIKVEYDELMTEQPELLAYLQEIDKLVGEEIGIKLGQLRGEEEAAQQGTTEEPVEGENPEGEEPTAEVEQPENTPAPTPAPTPTPKPVQKIKYVETTDNVNIRKSDSTNSEILGTAQKGKWYDFEERLDNGWTKIRYNGSYAYISSKYLKDIYEEGTSVSDTSENNNNSTEQVVGKVIARGTVNIRSGPGTEYDKLGVLAGGESLDSLGESGEWTKVSFQKKVGYIKTEFLIKKNN